MFERLSSPSTAAGLRPDAARCRPRLRCRPEASRCGRASAPQEAAHQPVVAHAARRAPHALPRTSPAAVRGCCVPCHRRTARASAPRAAGCEPAAAAAHTPRPSPFLPARRRRQNQYRVGGARVAAAAVGRGACEDATRSLLFLHLLTRWKTQQSAPSERQEVPPDDEVERLAGEAQLEAAFVKRWFWRRLAAAAAPPPPAAQAAAEEAEAAAEVRVFFARCRRTRQELRLRSVQQGESSEEGGESEDGGESEEGAEAAFAGDGEEEGEEEAEEWDEEGEEGEEEEEEFEEGEFDEAEGSGEGGDDVSLDAIVSRGAPGRARRRRGAAGAAPRGAQHGPSPPPPPKEEPLVSEELRRQRPDLEWDAMPRRTLDVVKESLDDRKAEPLQLLGKVVNKKIPIADKFHFGNPKLGWAQIKDTEPLPLMSDGACWAGRCIHLFLFVFYFVSHV